MTTILYWFVLKTLKIYLAAIDPQYSVYSVHCTVVNTNSKYKEDDFTDSNAVAFSQDVFIYFLHEVPTCHPCSFVPSSPLYTSQPSVRLGELGW